MVVIGTDYIDSGKSNISGDRHGDLINNAKYPVFRGAVMVIVW
jgi:hypothetical protein